MRERERKGSGSRGLAAAEERLADFPGGAPGGSVAAPVLGGSASFPGGIRKGVEE